MTFIEQSLRLWGLEGSSVKLVAARENKVYRIRHAAGTLALRAHRKHYRTDAQLAAELDWMAWLGKAGLSVPAPISSHAGRYLELVDGIQIDVLTWLDGQTLDQVLPTLAPGARQALLHRLGQNMARLHSASDSWPEGSSCARPHWDLNGLLGAAPLWDRFWENPELSASQKDLLGEFRIQARDHLGRLAPKLDYGLIHADLVPSNVMSSANIVHFIDFDDGGFGFRLFEIATALLKHRSLPDFDMLRASMLEGYHSNRPLDITEIDLFLTLRAMTYVGWNMTRLSEDASGSRNTRFITQAVELAAKYLDPKIE